MRLIVEKLNDGWGISIPSENKKRKLNYEQARAFFEEMAKEEMLDAFYSKNNSDSLVTKYEDCTIVIKDYKHIKNRRYVNLIKDEVNNKIKSRIMKRVGKTLLVAGVVITFIALPKLTDIFGQEPAELEEAPIQIETLADEDNTYNIVVREAQIREYMDKYALIFGIPSNKQEILYDNYLDSLLESNNIEIDVANLFYQYYQENYYGLREIEYNHYSEEEQELMILKYATLSGIHDEDILNTMLAVHKLETSHGESDWCRQYNNLGGVMYENQDTHEVSIKKYPNLDAAALDYVNVFMRILKNSQKLDTYSPKNSIEYNMNPIYCTEKMNEEDPEWFEIVSQIKEELKAENHLEELLEILNNGYSHTL